jgi:hypothetical protein
VNEANTEEEDVRQWEKSQVVFDEFEKYLRIKGYANALILSHLEYSSFFMMNYFFVFEDELSVLDADDTTLRRFLGNWYIRENEAPNFTEIKEILAALHDFFEFAFQHEFIEEEQFQAIKQLCSDTLWFENRLKTYKNSDAAGLKKWIEQHNYDW